MHAHTHIHTTNTHTHSHTNTLAAQVHTFYEAVGLMVGAESDVAKRDEYLVRLMAPPNATWQQIIDQVRVHACMRPCACVCVVRASLH